MATQKKIKIKPVNKANWKDFEILFQSKGAPSYCWCMAWRMTADELKKNTKKNRKGFIHKRVQAGIPIGLLAYSGSDAIGWCSIAPRDTYKRLGGDESLEKVWSIACFYIKREFRDQGLIDIFIAHAKKYAKKKGAKFIESYPVKPSSPSYRFMGFVNTFEKAGFDFVKKAGTRRNVMTSKL